LQVTVGLSAVWVFEKQNPEQRTGSPYSRKPRVIGSCRIMKKIVELKYTTIRFDKVIPKENWTAEKTNQRIETVMSDIATFNRAMNKIDSQMNELKNRKGIIKKKVAYKWKYLKQLQKQLKEM
jgi:hypothetical protein